MTLQEYIDRYAALARAVHFMSSIEVCMGDEVRISGCAQMTHCSCNCLPGDLKGVPYVHLYSGIREIAQRLDIPLHEQEDDEDTRRLWFVYKEVEFIQLEDIKK